MRACLLCGMRIEDAHYLGMPKSHKEHQRVSKGLWKEIGAQRSQHFMVSASEVENACIDRFPLLWLGLYRASKPPKLGTGETIFAGLINSVIKRSDTVYHLTGINVIQDHREPLHAVKDPEKARMSGTKYALYNPRVFTRFYEAYVDRRTPTKKYEGKTIGYFVHAHCWSLFVRVEGLGLNNFKLGKLVKVCRKYWWQKIRKPLQDWDGLFSRLTIKTSLSEGLGNTQNPLLISEIQQAIHSAKTACDDLSSGLSILPLELMVLISEYICPVADYTVDDVQNLRNMLLTFRWELPTWFWRRRLDERLFFELRDYNEGSSTKLNLRLNLMSLVADPQKRKYSGLCNRERVLEMMRAFKEAYTE